MSKTIEMEPPVFCMFCGRPKSMVKKMIQTTIPATALLPHVCICNECIDTAYELIHEGEEEKCL